MRCLRVGFIVAAVAALPAAPAQAEVLVDDERVTVTTRDARVVAQRAPFRLDVQDAAGRSVLRQVENTRPAAALQPPTAEPEPGGGDGLPDGVQYQPFAFEVGGSANADAPASPWVGVLVAGGRAGAVFMPTEVRRVERDGEVARLTVATNDPAGRELVVTLRPDGAGAVRVTARVTPDAGVTAVASSFASGRDEAFRGFGGRHNALDQRGEDFVNYLQAQNVGAGPFQPAADAVPGGGGDRYLFPNGPQSAFYVQSLFASSRPYAFLLGNDELSRWRMASDREDAWQVAAAAPELDFTVAAGPARRSIAAINAINGRHRVPADWALGPTLYRGVRVLSPQADTPQTTEQKVRADLRRIDAEGLAGSVVTSYAIEGWATLPRPVLRDLVREIERRGMRTVLYIRSYASADAAGSETPDTFRTAVERGYGARTAAGTPYVFGSTFIAGAAVLIDFTNPEAVRWWQGRVREMLELGADGFMQDFGEQVLQDMRFFDGSTGAQMHNRYPTLYHRATREVVEQWEREHPGERIFFFTRAGYSGRPGSAAFESANFPGDETTDWSRSSGIASLATDMLNRGIGGAFGFNTDIGGYADFHTPPPTRELYVRWSQWAALSPVFRVHNSSSNGTRMPWAYDREALELWRDAAELHVAARPYIRRVWAEAVRTGLPITRPLWLAHPELPDAARQDQAWLLGDDVLVAPVVTRGATSREVWFPPGCWRAPDTGERFTGPATRTVSAPLSRLPYFFRCGTRPFGPPEGSAAAAAGRRCVSRRRFAITVPRRMRRARIVVGARRSRPVRGRRAVVDLRGVRGARLVRVRLTGRTASGRRVVVRRAFRTCTRRGAR